MDIILKLELTLKAARQGECKMFENQYRLLGDAAEEGNAMAIDAVRFLDTHQIKSHACRPQTMWPACDLAWTNAVDDTTLGESD